MADLTDADYEHAVAANIWRTRGARGAQAFDELPAEQQSDYRLMAREAITTLRETEARYGTRETRPWWEPAGGP
jgi:hypothetical protein